MHSIQEELDITTNLWYKQFTILSFYLESKFKQEELPAKNFSYSHFLQYKLGGLLG